MKALLYPSGAVVVIMSVRNLESLVNELAKRNDHKAMITRDELTIIVEPDADHYKEVKNRRAEDPAVRLL